MDGFVSFVSRLISRRVGGGIALSSVHMLVGATAAIASIPDSRGVIHGCYQKQMGQLRVIDAANTSCRPDEVVIHWNQTGPQGPAGPPAPPGLSGTPVYSLFVEGCGGGPANGQDDFGFITGTFSSSLVQNPTSCGGSFEMHRNWTFQNLTGPGGPYAIGTGTALCNPCTVGGFTGSVSFGLTVLSVVQTNDSGPFTVNLGGAWTITEATGALAGLTGQGTYSGNPPVFIGTYKLAT
jgi:hypothetical protein